ncbi:hypothetical protein EE612_040190, partial [Oryza sativa]
GLGVAPRDVAGVALEDADHVPGLDGAAVLAGVVAVEVGGVGGAVAAGLEREGPEAEAVLAGVEERAVVPLLDRVHVRDEDLRHEAAVEHLPPPPRAAGVGVGVVDGGQRDDRAGPHVEAHVELPVGPPAVAAAQPYAASVHDACAPPALRLHHHAGRRRRPGVRRPGLAGAVVRPLRLGHRVRHPVPVPDDGHPVEVHHQRHALQRPRVEVGRRAGDEAEHLRHPAAAGLAVAAEPTDGEHRAEHVVHVHPAPPHRLHERRVLRRQRHRRELLLQRQRREAGAAVDGVREDGRGGGVGDVDAELVGLAAGAGDDERAAREGVARGAAATAVGVGEHIGFVGLVEADVVEGERAGRDERGGEHRGADGGKLGGGEGVERVGAGCARGG